MVVVAQLAERWLVEPDVAGSSPVDHPMWPLLRGRNGRTEMSGRFTFPRLVES